MQDTEGPEQESSLDALRLAGVAGSLWLDAVPEATGLLNACIAGMDERFVYEVVRSNAPCKVAFSISFLQVSLPGRVEVRTGRVWPTTEGIFGRRTATCTQ